jgi:2-dehydro-3-deoxygluconokinase
MTNVVTVGETMGLLYTDTVGRLSQATDMKLGIGGAESNVAIALTRLGTPASWIGRVGADSFGERILRELRAEGVDIHAVVDSSSATGLMFKERLFADSTRVWYYRSDSAGSRLRPEDLSPDLIAQASVLHLTGITPALSESAREATFEAIRLASEAMVPISFDVNHRSALWRDRDAGSVYREMARAATIVFAGVEEAQLLAPGLGDSAELARDIKALGPSQVVIKLGASGCFALVDGVEYVEPAIPIKAVDTIGAGDAFAAGYLSELVAGKGVTSRLRTAVTTGAYACLAGGDWEGLPRRSELPMLDSDEPVTR